MNYFNNFKNPKVCGDLDVYTFLDLIQNPDVDQLKKILRAREVYLTDKEEYNRIKASISCYTLNFCFKEYMNKSNILKATGFIYLDVDGNTNLIEHELVFASWLSLSGNGRGYLVRVEGLTINNFNEVYKDVASKIGVKVDKHAGKPTQYTVNSYDESIYKNVDSKVYKIAPQFNIISKRKVSTQMGNNYKLRFNNYDEVDFGGEEFIYFDEIKYFAEVFIPKKISNGKRNSVLFNVGRQIKALNIDIEYDDLSQLLIDFNSKHCEKSLSSYEINKIIANAFNFEGEPLYNKPRRFLINKCIVTDKKAQDKLKGILNGKTKSKNTCNKLQEIVDNWDYEKLGKITQKKLKEVSRMNKKTIEKYYKYLKK